MFSKTVCQTCYLMFLFPESRKGKKPWIFIRSPCFPEKERQIAIVLHRVVRELDSIGRWIDHDQSLLVRKLLDMSYYKIRPETNHSLSASSEDHLPSQWQFLLGITASNTRHKHSIQTVCFMGINWETRVWELAEWWVSDVLLISLKKSIYVVFLNRWCIKKVPLNSGSKSWERSLSDSYQSVTQATRKTCKPFIRVTTLDSD